MFLSVSLRFSPFLSVSLRFSPFLLLIGFCGESLAWGGAGAAGHDTGFRPLVEWRPPSHSIRGHWRWKDLRGANEIPAP